MYYINIWDDFLEFNNTRAYIESHGDEDPENEKPLMEYVIEHFKKCAPHVTFELKETYNEFTKYYDQDIIIHKPSYTDIELLVELSQDLKFNNTKVCIYSES